MSSFPHDIPLDDAIRAFEKLGFTLLRRGNHIQMIRENRDKTRTPLTMPSHRRLKASTVRTILTQAKIDREDFLSALRSI